MLLPRLGALLVAANAVQAFKDASPFFMLSSSPIKAESSQIATADDLQHRILDSMRECPFDLYLLVQQPGLTIADISDADTMPLLRERVAGMPEQNVMQIPSVLGQMNVKNLSSQIARNCGSEEISLLSGYAQLDPDVDVVKRHQAVSSDVYRALPAAKDSRRQALIERDEHLDTLFEAHADKLSWVLIYASTPASLSGDAQSVDPEIYEMDEPYPTALHQDLKRDLSAQRRQANGTDNPHSNLPLFEKYMFLTPGLFMGLFVSLLLISILWVGVSAIAGLQVSYMAFNKEMGPQAQNKGKQQ